MLILHHLTFTKPTSGHVRSQIHKSHRRTQQIFGEQLLYGIRREKSERDEQIARNITRGRRKEMEASYNTHTQYIRKTFSPFFVTTSVPKKGITGRNEKSLRIHHPVATKSTQTKKGGGEGGVCCWCWWWVKTRKPVPQMS